MKNSQGPILVLLVLSQGYGQTLVDLRTQTKSVDFTGANTTKPFKSGTTLPVTCSIGEAFFKTNASAGANLYSCTSLNAWTLEAGTPGPAGPQGPPMNVGGRGHDASYPTYVELQFWKRDHPGVQQQCGGKSRRLHAGGGHRLCFKPRDGSGG